MSVEVRSANTRRLAWAFGLVATVMVVEAIAAVLTRSLALLSDAGHMVTDAVGLGIALAAALAAARVRAGRHRTYGLYRLEILAALGNAVVLLGVAGYVLYEAIQRMSQPAEVAWQPMLIVGSIGLAANVASWAILRQGAETSLNVEAAMMEVLADLWGSVGVIGAAVVLATTGWPYADAVVGVAIGIFILPRGWRLAARAIRVLVQAAPPHVDLQRLRTDLEGIPGVVDVHDLHVWTLTSDMDVASVHLMINDDCEPHPVLDRAQQIMKAGHGIGHATLQVEPRSHVSCRDVSC
ncbi:MAG TPA: cation diffusion facilitator family transporter [Acidimicrobiia bacterium]|jgi:cobalt-zinc-cadmium efflux system protein